MKIPTVSLPLLIPAHVCSRLEYVGPRFIPKVFAVVQLIYSVSVKEFKAKTSHHSPSTTPGALAPAGM